MTTEKSHEVSERESLKVVEASRYLSRQLGRRPPGRYLAAVWGANDEGGKS